MSSYKLKLNYRCDEPNHNNRVYPREVLEVALKKFIASNGWVTDHLDQEALLAPLDKE